MLRLTKHIFLFITVGFMLSSCEFKDLSLNGVSGFNVDKMSKSGMLGTLQVGITNPNSYAIKVTGADFEIFSNGSKMGTAKLKHSFKIKANSTETYPVKLEANLTNVLAGGISSILGAISGKSPKVNIKGDLKARAFIFSKTIPVDFMAELPMDKIKL